MIALRLGLLSSLVACAACGGEPLSTAVLDRAVIHGQPAPQDVAVVKITVHGVPGVWCSGTIVAPNAVLTAAHCLMRLAALDVVIQDGTATSTIAALSSGWQLHPDYHPAQPGAHDLGVLPLSMRTAVPQARMSSEPVRMGERIRVVGWGKSDFGPNAPSGRRLTATATVTGVEAASFDFGVANCEGDSGGPAFIERGGVEQLAGVTAAGDVDCRVFGVDARVDVDLAWIESAVAAIEAIDAGIEDAGSSEDAGAGDAGLAPDANAPGGGGGSSCDCASTPHGDPAGLAVLALAGLLERRRRLCARRALASMEPSPPK